MQNWIHKEDISKGGFTLLEETEEAGIITYSKAGRKTLIIDHTEVYENFSGKGLGRKLVDKVVHYARENNLKIIPLCPYAKKVFEKEADFMDVWDK